MIRRLIWALFWKSPYGQKQGMAQVDRIVEASFEKNMEPAMREAFGVGIRAGIRMTLDELVLEAEELGPEVERWAKDKIAIMTEHST